MSRLEHRLQHLLQTGPGGVVGREIQQRGRDLPARSALIALLGLVPHPIPGPPDAPLDVQIEPGPSPGILIISWLPVTIDAAGTSNGVRVMGYAVYADGQKVWPRDSACLDLGS